MKVEVAVLGFPVPNKISVCVCIYKAQNIVRRLFIKPKILYVDYL